jgi:hypothetical protein
MPRNVTMSRSIRHKRTPAKVRRGLPRGLIIFLVIAFLCASFIGWQWWNTKQEDVGFRQLAEQGQPALSGVRSFAAEGLAQHVPQGSSVVYRTEPPTTGPHYPTPTDPGYYETRELPGNLVHALEHGNIVIYYDRPSPKVIQTLRGWASHFQDPWAGVVVTPMPGISEEIILTAWTKELRLQTFDPVAAAAFIDRFRGRGPEHPIR